MENTIEKLNFGDIVYVDFGKIDGITHCQRGLRPAIILTSQSILNRANPPIIQVVPVTSKNKLQKVHINLTGENAFNRECYAVPEQITTVDKSQLHDVIGQLSKTSMDRIKKAIYKQLALYL